MEITLFYSKNQRKILLEAGLKPDMLYFLRGDRIPEDAWRRVNTKKLKMFPGIVDVLKEIEETKRIIDPVVDDYVMTIENMELRKIVEYITKSPSWRERPLIMRLATIALGSNYTEEIIIASAALELFEESAILLDDVIDEAEVCVGKDTAWRKYGINETFIAHGVITSLARMTLLESCKKAKVGAEKTLEIMSSFEEIYHGDYVGQYMDINSEKRIDFSENDYFKMISKTPGSQFANALEIVCILTEKDEYKEDLKKFGRIFGMMAQLRDDIVDIIGDEDVVHKKLLTDILRKKKRLPLILLLNEVPKYKDLFSKDSFTLEERLPEIVKVIHKNNILENCKSKIKNLAKKAVNQLRSINDSRQKWLLIQIIYMLANFDEKNNL